MEETWSNLVGQANSAWGYVWASSTVNTSTLVVVLALASVVLVLEPHAWRVTRFFVTLVHEWGHAFVAILVGRRLRSIKLRFDTSGVTSSTGRGSGLGVVLKTMAGYPGPALVGLLLAYLVSIQKVNLALIVLASSSLMLLVVRNLFGVVSIVVWNAIVIGTLWVGLDGLSVSIAIMCAFVLMVGAMKAAVELRRRRPDPTGASLSDSEALGQSTFIPAIAWTWFFLTVCAASLAGGVVLLFF